MNNQTFNSAGGQTGFDDEDLLGNAFHQNLSRNENWPPAEVYSSREGGQLIILIDF